MEQFDFKICAYIILIGKNPHIRKGRTLIFKSSSQNHDKDQERFRWARLHRCDGKGWAAHFSHTFFFRVRELDTASGKQGVSNRCYVAIKTWQVDEYVSRAGRMDDNLS